jgi:hypothetical protein
MDITGNPFIILASDVAGLISGQAGTTDINGTTYLIVWKGPVPVLQVEFAEYTATTDTAEVDRFDNVDVNSPREFAFLNGASDFETVRTGMTGWVVNGLLIPNNGITSGRVNIYHR